MYVQLFVGIIKAVQAIYMISSSFSLLALVIYTAVLVIVIFTLIIEFGTFMAMKEYDSAQYSTYDEPRN